MIVAALVVAAPVAVDAIAPPLGIVLHQTSEQVRDDGHAVRRFRIARDIVFAADGDGFVATVTLKSAEVTADPAERHRYAEANAALLNRPIVIRLDRGGGVRAVDDLDAVSGDWASGLATLIPTGQSIGADALRARLQALPPARRQAMIGSMASALFATPDERHAAPARVVSLASPAPFTDVKLAGTLTQTAQGDTVRIRSAAQGRADPTPTMPAAAVAVTRERLVEGTSGLIVDTTERESLTGRGLKLIVTTHSTLAR